MNRKKFLHLSSLGVFSLFIPKFIFSKENHEHLPVDVNALLKAASNLRKQKSIIRQNRFTNRLLASFQMK